ncbi:MAG TPA: tetratricopeptide repeat protein [Thermoanaerobaculia bacterium]|nr:tetratricopeptide repeat protein [Thermoanaerobaculia bacterium]
MRRKLWFAVATSLWLVAGSAVVAQEWAGRGRLQGEIKDEQGKPVEGAKLTLRIGSGRVDPAAPGPKAIFTNDKGKWVIGGLAGGAWGVLIQKEGFIDSEGQVHVDEFSPTKPVNLTLKVIPKEVIAAQHESAQNAELNAMLAKGDELFVAKNWSGARAEYEKALPKLEDKLKPAVLKRVAKTYLQEEKFDQVAAPLEQALALAPDDAEALRLLAPTYYQLKQTDKAIDTLKRALAITPDDAALNKLMVDFLVDAGREDEAKVYMAKLPQGTKVDPASLLNIGIRQFNEGKVKEAFESFDRVVQENPGLSEAYYYRGLTAISLSADSKMSAADQKAKVAIAKADFKKLLEIDPNSPHAADAREYLKSL